MDRPASVLLDYLLLISCIGRAVPGLFLFIINFVFYRGQYPGANIRGIKLAAMKASGDLAGLPFGRR